MKDRPTATYCEEASAMNGNHQTSLTGLLGHATLDQLIRRELGFEPPSKLMRKDSDTSTDYSSNTSSQTDSSAGVSTIPAPNLVKKPFKLHRCRICSKIFAGAQFHSKHFAEKHSGEAAMATNRTLKVLQRDDNLLDRDFRSGEHQLLSEYQFTNIEQQLRGGELPFKVGEQIVQVKTEENQLTVGVHRLEDGEHCFENGEQLFKKENQFTVGEHQFTGGEHQNTGVEHWSTGGEHQFTGGEHRSTGGEHQHTGGEHQYTGGERQSTGGEHPSTGGEHRSTGGEHQSTGGEPQSTGGERRFLGGEHQNSGGEHRSKGGERQSTDGDHQFNGQERIKIELGGHKNGHATGNVALKEVERTTNKDGIVLYKKVTAKMGGDAGDKNYWWCAICGLLFWNLDLLKSHQTKGFCGNLNRGSAQKMLVAKVSNNSNCSNSREDLPSKTFPKGTVILLKKERKERKRRVDAKLDKMKPVVVLIDCVQKTQDGKPTRVVCLDLGRMKPPQVPGCSGGSKLVPGGSKLVPGGSKLVPGGSKQVPEGSKPSPSENYTVLTHLLNKGPSACHEAPPGPKAPPRPKAPPGAKAIYVCEHCGMRFTRELLYKAHVPLHGESGNSFFECSVCKKVFAEVNALEHHKYKEYHYVAFYVCRICDSKYVNHSLLDYHLTLHSINGTHTFRIKSEKNGTLYLTPKTREEVKRFECGSCGLRFEKEFLMMSHIETVHRENPSEDFICGICSERFVDPESLEWHKSDQNHYDCDICLETFDDNDSLKQHKYDYNHYDSYFVCRFCPRKFTDRRPLDFHQSNTHVLETRWWKDHYKK